ncbi:MAG: calcium/sodium antiporter [Bacteroidetes bacterium]|jgi:cation:H+ antiporter|nr:calcium/sodium antiporter [Bacteroidota bacterium]
MVAQLLIFSAGLVVLYLGAEWLVRGAASLALRYGIRRIVVGITVVALGTSMPEFVINFFAALAHEDSLALGNIVGSNISNIALILGTSALVLPMAVRPSTLRKEYPIMMGVMILFYLVALDGVISKLDGLVLVFCLVLFMVYLVIDGKRHARKVDAGDEEPVEVDAATSPVWKKVLFLIGGIAFLAVGARLMVYSAVNIAESMGIEPVVVGLTIVAIGTSLPELAASLVSAVKQEADMSIGNVLGSNLLNVLFVVGLVALIRPLQVDADSLSIHFPVMLGFSALLLPVAWTSYQISRVEGGMLVTVFLGYIVYLIFPYL